MKGTWNFIFNITAFRAWRIFIWETNQSTKFWLTLVSGPFAGHFRIFVYGVEETNSESFVKHTVAN